MNLGPVRSESLGALHGVQHSVKVEPPQLSGLNKLIYNFAMGIFKSYQDSISTQPLVDGRIKPPSRPYLLGLANRVLSFYHKKEIETAIGLIQGIKKELQSLNPEQDKLKISKLLEVESKIVEKYSFSESLKNMNTGCKNVLKEFESISKEVEKLKSGEFGSDPNFKDSSYKKFVIDDLEKKLLDIAMVISFTKIGHNYLDQKIRDFIKEIETQPTKLSENLKQMSELARLIPNSKEMQVLQRYAARSQNINDVKIEEDAWKLGETIKKEIDSLNEAVDKGDSEIRSFLLKGNIDLIHSLAAKFPKSKELQKLREIEFHEGSVFYDATE